ncbi:MAG TPA: maltotransferase domain-containing protein, partial [Myxococcaceae bacterium]|nr:maltotransferase domain-containing protein [Myxococcaceae bacterium]
MNERIGSVIIENVGPSVDAGTYPVKRVVGEPIRVEADIFKEGHDLLSAVVRWRKAPTRALGSLPTSPPVQEGGWTEVPMEATVNDRWAAELRFPEMGRYLFTVEAWTDGYRSWAQELSRKVKAGQKVKSELLEGAALLKACASRASGTDAAALKEAEAQLSASSEVQASAAALKPELIALASRYADRAIATRHPQELGVWVEPVRAAVGAWYEFFPRSTGPDAQTHGTFADAEKMLEYVQSLGFDVVYLPPIHPIGRTARKGKNNTLKAESGDVGSPWAIGAAEGGHKSIHPQLGTLEDFKRFVNKARGLGIDVALDLAYQCSPDHPYVKEHPEWFSFRPDGTLKTAENPPKRYEDIVNFDWLGPAREALWTELRSVVLFWVEAGVRIFRVDNPHTKPVRFWQWMIDTVRAVHPDVVFLSEAFTRPKMMKVLAKVGFSQSYTYFTWRNFK